VFHAMPPATTHLISFFFEAFAYLADTGAEPENVEFVLAALLFISVIPPSLSDLIVLLL
jgi:hypothetical protein